jgi:acetylornithine/N-succinyldiaminopimelate aminotransferase
LAKNLQERNPSIISDIRGWGLISGVEIAESCPANAPDVAKALLEAGVLVVPAGPKVVRFVPPLIVTETEINNAFRKFEEALVQLSQTSSSAEAANDSMSPFDVIGKWFSGLVKV